MDSINLWKLSQIEIVNFLEKTLLKVNIKISKDTQLMFCIKMASLLQITSCHQISQKDRPNTCKVTLIITTVN